MNLSSLVSSSSSASSRMPALPEPLSLMPAPSVTESRYAPTTTFSSVSPLSELRAVGERSTDDRDVDHGLLAERAAAELGPAGLTSLKMITAEAPASSARSALTPQLHKPCWISAML